MTTATNPRVKKFQNLKKNIFMNYYEIMKNNFYLVMIH